MDELINNVLGIQPASAEEVFYKSQITTSPNGGPMLKTGLSYNIGTFTPKTVPTKIEAIAETGEALSAGLNIKDLVEAMAKDANKFDKTILKRLLQHIILQQV